MKLDRKGIPAKVLNGDSRKYMSVHTTYKAILAQEVMKRVNASFWARAKRGSDDLGNTWIPLAPSTHAYKPLSPIEKNTYEIDGKLTRGLLTPLQDKLWQTIFARIYNRLVKKGKSEASAKKEAAERAWGVVKARGARTLIGLNRITDTNIRTGRLVAATKPGTVSNNRYYPPKNQVVDIRPRAGIRIRFLIPYIKEVDKVRPVIPNDISPWILEAHEIAIQEAKRVYERIRETTPDRKRSPKSKPTTRDQTNRNKRNPRR
jgi:regulator of sigma D